MCGIAVLINKKQNTLHKRNLEQMRDLVSHRGPDGAGIELFNNRLQPTSVETDWRIGLAHRRLSIIDISSAGHQPMCYNQRYWITYNGEIYNFIELKQQLAQLGHSFSTDSDTEVILAAYSQWGKQCFSRFKGMWGMAILDTLDKTVVISRDRIGIKPLYFVNREDVFAIASEIKQFQALPQLSFSLNYDAAREYLVTGYENHQVSFFREVEVLEPGFYRVYHLANNHLEESESYWHPENIEVEIYDDQLASEQFYSAFSTSVNEHLRSDVPVGCALSGGLDSSSIVAEVYKQQQDTNQLNTFTVDFKNDPCSERFYVDKMLEKVQVKPNFIYTNDKSFVEHFEDFVYHHDEPVGSLSVYISYALAELVKQKDIKVNLNGQGGDEILGAYWQIYLVYLADQAKTGKIHKIFPHLFGALFPGGNNELVKMIPKYLSRYLMKKRNDKGIPFTANFKKNFNGQNILHHFFDLSPQAKRLYEIRNMFLPKYLKWDDRNSMAHSVEGRYPFLDHELIELTLRFNKETFYHRGWNKTLLRKSMKSYLPSEVLYRKDKVGFDPPYAKWTNGQIRQQLLSWFDADRPIWDIIPKENLKQSYFQRLNKAQLTTVESQELFRFWAFDKWLQIFNVNF